MLKTFLHKNIIEAGTDEAGRGCLSGPVVAAAVIMDPSVKNELVDDSKKMSHASRAEVAEWIKANAISWAVAFVDHQEIDKINILNASIKAMHLAIAKLDTTPEFILVDGNRFKTYKNISHECVIKGDGKFFSIAAASILAKTARDDYMQELHAQFPEYHWDSNKGYGTKAHRAAIEKCGPCEHHRMTFRLLAEPEQAGLF